ncbi:hypothetical protein K438DRAFT_1963739 [Mycena galopus ATCC 62051]|nr:hypothetical protein K438DRAFT_1963739 [Mycena galopus ATCC 62051]
MSVLTLLFLVPALCTASETALLAESKESLFLSAPSFAVIDEINSGQSSSMLEQGKDVVPINPFVAESACPASTRSPTSPIAPVPRYSSLPFVCFHSPCSDMDVLDSIDNAQDPASSERPWYFFVLWLQPSAEDDAVLEFIASDCNRPWDKEESIAPDLISTLLRRDHPNGQD